MFMMAIFLCVFILVITWHGFIAAVSVNTNFSENMMGKAIITHKLGVCGSIYCIYKSSMTVIVLFK